MQDNKTSRGDLPLWVFTYSYKSIIRVGIIILEEVCGVRGNSNAKVEIALVMLIAICMLMLIQISNIKLNEVMSTNNSIILRENPDKEIDNLLTKEIIKYKPDACTMMEIYDDNYNMIMRVPFSPIDDTPRSYFNLGDHKGLKDLLGKYPEGHTRIQMGDNEEDVYFRWTETNDSKRRLAIIYIARPVVKHLWLIPFLCYLILILIFILVVRVRMSCQLDRINFYHKTSMRVQSRMFNKNE